MKIESLIIQNYKVFRNVRIDDIPSLAVFLGKNGAGKTTFFDVFGFLHDCLITNVSAAISKGEDLRRSVPEARRAIFPSLFSSDLEQMSHSLHMKFLLEQVPGTK